MKRQLISLMIILQLLSLFSSLEVYAQKGDAILGPAPAPPKLKPAAKPARRTKRASLTTVEYTDRYGQIYYDYAKSKASLDATVTGLEELVKLAPDDRTRSTTYQFLGLLYLHGRHDAAKAEAFMEQAIKSNGSALVEISFDNKWRQMGKLQSGEFDFEDRGKGWLRIENGKLTLTDLNNEPLVNDKTTASLTGEQIKDLSKTLASAFTLVQITTNNTRRPYIFATRDKRQDEAELVIKLIKKHVQGKAN